jgi:hypothetical protein
MSDGEQGLKQVIKMPQRNFSHDKKLLVSSSENNYRNFTNFQYI